jgi:CRISPR/Cas system-associated exonuclease Cas4 (RecB family)
LSWSGFNTYLRCGLAYKKRYVDREKPERQNYYNTIGGKAIQRVFELFYNNEIWRRGDKVLPTLHEILPREYAATVADTIVDWDAPESKLTEEELLESLKPLIATTLKVIKDYKLLGKYARSEVKLQAWVDKVLVHGIADFVIRRNGEHMILDGKLTRHRSKYLKRDQLVWYAMLYYLQHRHLVERVGWIYYTYGELEWVPIAVSDVTRLHKLLEDTIKEIKRNKFPAKPSTKACRFCDYKDTCEEGKSYHMQTKWASAEKKQKKLEAANSPLTDDGSDEIGF